MLTIHSRGPKAQESMCRWVEKSAKVSCGRENGVDVSCAIRFGQPGYTRRPVQKEISRPVPETRIRMCTKYYVFSVFYVISDLALKTNFFPTIITNPLLS